MKMIRTAVLLLPWPFHHSKSGELGSGKMVGRKSKRWLQLCPVCRWRWESTQEPEGIEPPPWSLSSPMYPHIVLVYCAVLMTKPYLRSIVFPLYRSKNWSQKRLSYVPKVARLYTGEPAFKPVLFWLQGTGSGVVNLPQISDTSN